MAEGYVYVGLHSPLRNDARDFQSWYYKSKWKKIRFSHIEAENESLDMFKQFDVNTDVYPVKENEKFVQLSTPTSNKDGSAVSDYYTQGGICFIRSSSDDAERESLLCFRI